MSGSLWIFFGIYALVALERGAELVVSRRNAAWSFAHGGKEYGRAHFPAMVLLHSTFLVAGPLEAWWMERPLIPALAGSMLLLSLLTQGLRWWVITTLGPRWNTRVIVVPGLPLVSGGPFRYFRHPNYLAVVLELAALPLIHSAWITALLYTLLNAWMLVVRTRVENEALGYAR